MPSGELALLERQFEPLTPMLADALAGVMPVSRLIRTVIIACERTPKLLLCDRQTIFLGAMSAACLGLELDGVTGQGWLLPFEERRNNRSIAQLVIGYKGYSSIAARSNITITGEVIREGDDFSFDVGQGFVRHAFDLLKARGRIIGAWAKAAHTERPPIVTVLTLEEILATKTKSPGARRGDSPWNDEAVGFPAMASKTAKRRLARALPLTTIQHAAALDRAAEEGRTAYITPDKGLMIDSAPVDTAGPWDESAPQPTAAELTAPIRPKGAPVAAPNFDNLSPSGDDELASYERAMRR